ncbi:excinuclease ABC subunit C [Marivirga sp. S37H4]|uniref:UvrABC system protein C n=1 Tax=Marivirga aurantiaca TaxID=2802615 RepID=A0A934WZ39_9BACT|nr:excinuclease ABC subunit UvrC [Marivirga aurantiaca]MBK6265848.1 excinuclease ABC subunit C [Marivirga aurantiaca]
MYESPFFKRDEFNLLPPSPGIYKFHNSEGIIIYVGKAKNLKNRVTSYFNNSKTHNRKTLKLVSEIQKIEISIVNSEFDALLLENSLIKELQPKYNILLKDDKTFPYLCVTNEPFPRIIATRNRNTRNGTYFGPYASVRAMNNVLELIRKLYTIRTCKLNLSNKNIQSGKFKVCLEYHIGNCKGPCEGFQNSADYQKDIELAEQILKGNLIIPKQYFREHMEISASELQFEEAQKYKNKLELLEKFQSKSLVVNPRLTNIDVCSIISEEKSAFLNYMRIKNGSIIATQTIEIKKKLEESDAEILLLAIIDLRNLYQSASPEILTNIGIENIPAEFHFTTPQIGDKKKLVDMSLKNALFFKKEKLNQNESSKIKELRVIKQLQVDLQLKELPIRIECFDNSNLGGTNPVASMVHFKNGRPAKNEYRHYHIKTVVGPDDFASMTEIVGRRYGRLQKENLPLPNLIVIDGGKGQLNAACIAIKELGLYGEIPIIGIAKRLEEIYFPGDQFPLHISKKSESLKLLQRLRDEAHRFAITFHRNIRSKNTFVSDLEKISGIGEKTINELLTHFKSLRKIKDASFEELNRVVGSNKAEVLMKSFQHKKGES